MNVDQIFNGLEDNAQDLADYIRSHLACVGNRHGIGVDSLEALLENRMLTLGRGDLFFTSVTAQVLLQHGVHNEAWSVKKDKNRHSERHL